MGPSRRALRTILYENSEGRRLKTSGDFTVPAGKFVVVGDSRPPDYFEFFLEDSRRIPTIVFGAIAAEDPVCVFHAGDMAVFGSRHAFWQGWTPYDRDVAVLAERGIKIFPVIGNHEYRGFTRTPLAKLFSRFEHLGRRNYYSVGIGGLLVVCLDSNVSRMSAEAIEAQDRWLDDVLSKATQDPGVWLVLPILHHPPFTNVSPRYLVFESAEVQQRFVPRFLACDKVAAVIAGHVHTYERLLHEGVQFIVTGGGGSPRFKLKPETRRKHADLAASNGLVRPFHYLRLRPDDAHRRLAVETPYLSEGDLWTIGDRFELASRT
jgi:Calcineurin-like phosphoesterase